MDRPHAYKSSTRRFPSERFTEDFDGFVSLDSYSRLDGKMGSGQGAFFRSTPLLSNTGATRVTNSPPPIAIV